MPTYTVGLYDVDPNGILTRATGSTFTWTGPAETTGTATITDNEAGYEGFTLDDDSAGGETATADVTIGGTSSTNSTVDAEMVWVLRDTVTGEEFTVIQFQVENGGASGMYTLSEQPLIAGRTYEVLDYDNNPNAAAGDPAFSFANYVASDAAVNGTTADDTINTSFVDYDGDSIGVGVSDDEVSAGAGNDVILSGDGNDTVLGGSGADTITAGNGDDVVYGGDDGTLPPVTETLSWEGEALDLTDVSGGFTQQTGEMQVGVSFTTDGTNLPQMEIDSSTTQYVPPGESFSANSSLFLFGDGNGETLTATFDFSAGAGSAYGDMVENVSFAINDIDSAAGNHIDVVTVNAYDADGNPVPVTFTVFGDETVSGNTITAGSNADAADLPGGSVLIDIAGPVAQIEIIYSNTLTGTHGINITDLSFDAVAPADGADSISGGAGNDTLFGELGNDTILGETGNDVIDGGDGNDSVDAGAGNDVVYGGLGADTITGGDGNDTLSGAEEPTGSTGIGGTSTVGDTYTVINLGTFADVDPDEANSLSENAALLLGSYGGPGTELYNNFQTATANDTNADNTLADNDAGATPEILTVDGVDYFVDSTQVYNATVTFTDGTTGTFTAVVTQTTTGEVFMMPEFSNNPDNALLTSKPIESISLDTINTADSGLVADRLDADYQVPGTPTDSAADLIDGGAGDDVIDGYAGNDTLIGGTGSDTLSGGLGDDAITVAQGDVADGGDGDDYFTLADLAEAGAGTISITGGEGGETNGDTLQLTPDVTLADITFTNTDDAAGGLSGNFTMSDGTLVNFSEIENIICFTPGTMILTETGERPVEALRPGDRVITRDHGAQPLRWVGRSTVPGRGRFAPVRIAGHLIGARRPLLVSPQHRVLFEGYECEMNFGTDEVLAAATHLEDGVQVMRAPRPLVTYLHLMFDRHEIIYAEGAPTESFFAGDVGLAAISGTAREALFTAFPQLRSDPSSYGETARVCLKAREARLLVPPAPPVLMAA